MKSILQPLIRLVVSSTKTQGCGLTMIGIGMLISTNLAETLDHLIVREVVQVAIILAGILATAFLFSHKSSDHHPE